MIILHIAWLDAMQASGVNVVVPDHVRYQRLYADAALWCVHDRPAVEGLEQIFTAKQLDDLPSPYNRPDIAVFHGVYSPEFIPIYKQLCRLHIPYVIVVHGALIGEAQKKSRLKKLVGNFLLFKPFCLHAAGIQCLTEREKRDCIFGNNRFVAPNGILPQTVIKTTFRQQATKFVYIGRLDPHTKGMDILTEAFAIEKSFLAAQHCTLDIYGPDEDHGEFSAAVIQKMIDEQDVGALVTLHPPVYGKEKDAVLLDSDIFIQTSRNEGLPTSVLEALSHGLPCLVTEGASVADVITAYGAGWGAETNAASVAKALVKAVDQRDRLPALSQNALRCADSYRWETAAKTAVEQYRSIIEKERETA